MSDSESDASDISALEPFAATMERLVQALPPRAPLVRIDLTDAVCDRVLELQAEFEATGRVELSSTPCADFDVDERGRPVACALSACVPCDACRAVYCVKHQNHFPCYV
jgi:hypothetical protein